MQLRYSCVLRTKSFQFSSLKLTDVNPLLLNAQYAVRGKILDKAYQIQKEIDQSKRLGQKSQYSFDQITELNIGNPQFFGQPPISFNRQVLSCLIDPYRSHKDCSDDVIRRAKYYKSQIGASIGSYSHSLGYQFARQDIAKFIQRRDQTKEIPQTDRIIITDGASQGIQLVLGSLICGPKDGVMIPIPQYPLYSASINLCNGSQIPYYLDEESGWQITEKELEKQYDLALEKGIKPKIIVLINPGNPTGQVFDESTLTTFVKFSVKYNLVLLADEVYQENIYYPSKKFISVRKTALSLPSPYKDLNLFSFHSISKGIIGECGLRGGYCEVSESIPQDVYDQMYKQKTILLCSNTIGQCMTALMVTPPTQEEGCSDSTIQQYKSECQELFQSLKKRAQILQNSLNNMIGIKCQPIQGAMYAFPQLLLTEKFIKHAQSLGYNDADVYYCMEALKNTGMVFVPGSGFLQQPGTHHFRSTILIRPEELLESRMNEFKKWNDTFLGQFK